MNIIVVGLGKIGESIIKSVSKEGHNIVGIDSNMDKVNDIIERYDVNGVVGSATSGDIQKNAGVENCDLFIAVTSTDETNIIACMLAKNSGARLTIARVRNHEYSDQVELMKRKLGIDLIINPENETAKEFKRIISMPDALNIELFAQGRIELAEAIIEEESHLKGLSLIELRKTSGLPVLVAAVKRNDEIIIPKGDFVIQVGDKIDIVGTPSDLSLFFEKLGLLHSFIHDIVIIGGGKIAYYLAKLCEDKRYKVKIFESGEARAEELDSLLPNAIIVHGDGTDPVVLEEENFSSADAFFSLTGNDEENIVLSLYASKQGVPKVLAKVNRDKLKSILDDQNPISIVSPRNIVANYIVSLIRALNNAKGSNVLTYYKLAEGKVEALEFYAKDTFKELDVALINLRIKPSTLVAGIIRNGQAIIPNGNDVIKVNDRVLIVTGNKHYADLNDILLEG